MGAEDVVDAVGGEGEKMDWRDEIDGSKDWAAVLREEQRDGRIRTQRLAA